MNFDHYHIFIVEGDEQRRVVAEFKRERQAAHDRCIGWCKSQGGVSAIKHHGCLAGILAKPEGNIALGWKQTTKPGWVFPPHLSFVPNMKCKAGKELSRTMRSFVVPGGVQLAGKLGPSVNSIQWIDGQTHMLQSIAYEEGNSTILLIPKAKGATPKCAGCRLLKMSEFYALKEKSVSKKRKSQRKQYA